MTKAVLFDMDGVLVDSAQAHYQAWKTIAKHFDRELDFASFAPTMGTNNPTTIAALFGDRFTPMQVWNISVAKEELFRNAIRKNFTPIKGASELLPALRDAGWKMALASSATPENVKYVMDLLPNSELLTVRVDTTMASKSKPAPDLFLKAAELLGVDPGAAVVVEDSIAGLTAARAAGMAALGLTTTLDRETMLPHADLTLPDLLGANSQIFEELLAQKHARG